MQELPEYIDGLPNLCGSEQLIEAAIKAGRRAPVLLGQTPVEVSGIDSAFAVALHMHQPLIPAGGPDPRTAAPISNLQWMLEHPDVGDNHNAGVPLVLPADGRAHPPTAGRGQPAADHA